MKVTEMHCIEAPGAYENVVFSKQPLLSPIDESQLCSLPHHLKAIDVRCVTTHILREASVVRHTPPISAMQLHPPQVDVSACKNIGKKTRTCAPGMWWRMFSLQVVSRPLSIAPLKKIIVQSSLCLAAYYGQRDAASLWLFYGVRRDDADHAISSTCMNPLFFEPMSPRGNVISRPVSSTSLSIYIRRESYMFPQQPINSTATNQSHSLIERVLSLRQQLGIDIHLSISDPEDTFLCSIEQELSMGTPRHTPSPYNSRDWLSWSQSPSEGKLPEKGPGELL